MPIDSAWIFRICLVTAVFLILFADFLGYGGANARKSDKDESDASNSINKDEPSGDYRRLKSSSNDDNSDESDKLDMRFFKTAVTEKERLEQKRAFEMVQQRLTDSLRDLCLPKLLCEIAAKPTYMLNEKEKHVLSLLRSTSMSLVANSPSVWHFSSHMGQLLRHSADSLGAAPIGCALLWPNCPYSSDKLMKLSAKVRLR